MCSTPFLPLSLFVSSCQDSPPPPPPRLVNKLTYIGGWHKGDSLLSLGLSLSQLHVQCEVKHKQRRVWARIGVRVCIFSFIMWWGQDEECMFAYMQIARRCLHFNWRWWLKCFSLTLCCNWPHYFLTSQISMNRQDLSHISHCVKVNLTMKTQILHENLNCKSSL